MTRRVDPAHVPRLLMSAGKAIAGMPEGHRVIDEMRKAATKDDLLFLLRSSDLGLEQPARDAIYDAAADDASWEDIRSRLVRSAEIQLTEQFSSNA